MLYWCMLLYYLQLLCASWYFRNRSFFPLSSFWAYVFTIVFDHCTRSCCNGEKVRKKKDFFCALFCRIARYLHGHFYNFLKLFELVFQFASSAPLLWISFLYDSYSFWLSALFILACLFPFSSAHLPPSALFLCFSLL